MIVPHTDPRIREISAPVEPDEDLEALLAEMRSAATGDLGLAAIQIGVPKRVIIARAHRSHEFFVFKNPLIVERSVDDSYMQEGCLSCRNDDGSLIFVNVLRAWSIVVEHGFPRFNAKTEMRPRHSCRGILARVIQHEIDHLDAKLIIDHLSGARTR